MILGIMKTTAGRVQTFVASHPRLVTSILVLALFLAASGGAAALDAGAGLDGVTLGDAGTTDSGSSYGGPTDP